MRLCFAFGACAASLNFASAAEKSNPDWAKAYVYVDGAAVYAQPDFDAQMIDQLNEKFVLWASVKAFKGLSGLGLFHQVRYAGKIGYLADTDLRILKSAAPKSAPPAKDPSPVKKDKRLHDKAWGEDEEDSKRRNNENTPLLFRRYAGGALAIVDYSEKFSGQALSSYMPLYGLRLSGPGTILDGPPLDVNVWFSIQNPGFLSQVSSGAAQGFLLFGDVMTMLPFYEWKHSMVNYGLGLMWVYSNYKIPFYGQTVTSQELRFGVDLDLGYTQAIKTWAIKADIKYYVEVTHYFGYVLSVQTEY